MKNCINPIIDTQCHSLPRIKSGINSKGNLNRTITGRWNIRTVPNFINEYLSRLVDKGILNTLKRGEYIISDKMLGAYFLFQRK